MEEKGVYLAIQTPRQVRKKPMYKNGMYRETDKMSDLICDCLLYTSDAADE